MTLSDTSSNILSFLNKKNAILIFLKLTSFWLSMLKNDRSPKYKKKTCLKKKTKRKKEKSNGNL